ncbi:DinB family protein [Saxibacter everestensis]|uniref:DinB family protein n=1 Tax=Saxibacter everestensis TaxID=2909229 RepID=A0ABY8QT37_9MICO|nr:DinB family protein [Brevibacteriaceae bacterium ZFBP1038]
MNALPPPPRDTKDWTWVLDRPCPECGFNSTDFDRDDFADRIDDTVNFWRARLAADDVRIRPEITIWSPLEYGCHIRDALAVFDQRFALMLSQDDAHFDDWDPDQAALTGEYPLQNPRTVAGQIAVHGAAVSERLRSMRPEDWNCTGSRSNGSLFTVDSLARYLLHDLIHHEWDVDVS